jgi:DNA polymerase elongation subunit (family B)
MVTKEDLNNARNKMLEQKKFLLEKRNQRKEQNLISNDNIENKSSVELSLLSSKTEKKKRILLTKTESISILITETEKVKKIRAKITDPENDFYPSKSDIYRLGVSLLDSLKDEEITEMIKSIKL